MHSLTSIIIKHDDDKRFLGVTSYTISIRMPFLSPLVGIGHIVIKRGIEELVLNYLYTAKNGVITVTQITIRTREKTLVNPRMVCTQSPMWIHIYQRAGFKIIVSLIECKYMCSNVLNKWKKLLFNEGNMQIRSMTNEYEGNDYGGSDSPLLNVNNSTGENSLAPSNLFINSMTLRWRNNNVN